MASKIIKTTVEINQNQISHKFRSLADEVTMLRIHNEFARFMEPYVPFDASSPDASITVTPEFVKYDAPYAHYHYEGLVYGPNIPIIEDGIVVGWFSIPDKPKHPTGKQLKFQKAKASAHWDEAMMRERKEEFVKEVHDLLRLRAQELYG